jgi:hypothetical protein
MCNNVVDYKTCCGSRSESEWIQNFASISVGWIRIKEEMYQKLDKYEEISCFDVLDVLF